jgi:hypothetical protein
MGELAYGRICAWEILQMSADACRLGYKFRTPHVQASDVEMRIGLAVPLCFEPK